MPQVVRRFKAEVESIKRAGADALEVRARPSDKAPGTAASIFFEMGLNGPALLIGESLLVTVENQLLSESGAPIENPKDPEA